MLYLCYLLMTETNLAMYPFKVFSLSISLTVLLSAAF
jgi:hypothetical protein